MRTIVLLLVPIKMINDKANEYRRLSPKEESNVDQHVVEKGWTKELNKRHPGHGGPTSWYVSRSTSRGQSAPR